MKGNKEKGGKRWTGKGKRNISREMEKGKLSGGVKRKEKGDF